MFYSVQFTFKTIARIECPATCIANVARSIEEVLRTSFYGMNQKV